MSLELRPEVAAFAQLMEAKLRENDHKGGWKDCSVRYLAMRVGIESMELMEALEQSPDDDVRIGREAADVANFVMMIADVCGALAGASPVEGKETRRGKEG